MIPKIVRQWESMKLEEFIEKFRQLKAEGFIPSTRKGATGIGHTLETYLGMTENNIALPDIRYCTKNVSKYLLTIIMLFYQFKKNHYPRKKVSNQKIFKPAVILRLTDGCVIAQSNYFLEVENPIIL